MPRSTQILPDGYKQVLLIDLVHNKSMVIMLNLVGLGVIALSFWLLAIFANRVHPELSGISFRIAFSLFDVLLLLLLVVANMLVHEIIHGIFFWRFTRARPSFGFGLSYAYAAAPDWYIPRSQYGIIALAPLLLIDIAGLLVMVFCSPA